MDNKYKFVSNESNNLLINGDTTKWIYPTLNEPKDLILEDTKNIGKDRKNSHVGGFSLSALINGKF